MNRGTKTPSSPMLFRLSNALNCSVDFLSDARIRTNKEVEDSSLENNRPLSTRELVETLYDFIGRWKCPK